MATGILNNPPYSLDEAVQRGDAVYEVIYRNWGLGRAGSITQWPDNGQPGASVSLAGMAIGPRSTVDRCWVSYNLGKYTNPAPTAAADIQALTNRLRRLSLGSPLLFTQPAAPKTSSDPGTFQGDNPLLTMTKLGSLYVYCVSNGGGNGNVGQAGYGEYPGQIESTQINADSGGGAQTYFDINGVAQNMNIDTWVGPQLHLVLYLKPPSASPPTKRMPLKIISQTTLNANGTEQIVQNIATHGRNNVHVMMFCSVGPSSFRVGALRATGVNSVPFNTFGMPYEEPMDVATGVAANVRTVLSSCNQDGVYADFTNLYCTPPNLGGTCTVTYVVSAYD